MIIKLSSEDDFLGPSQLCVKPVKKSSKPAEINLTDCLACSGCVTSAESILVAAQSHEEVKTQLSNSPEGRLNVASISPQSLASLAIEFNLTSAETLDYVSALLRLIGFHHTLDTTFARHISLRQTVREYNTRSKTAAKTVLASACPGWVCYAEKTQHSLLPLMSAVRSPQAIQGRIVKSYLAQKWGRRPEDIYHVSIMPCYDKKLEASRDDFIYSDEAKKDIIPETDTASREVGGEMEENVVQSVRETDCVITTAELLLLLPPDIVSTAREQIQTVSTPLDSSIPNDLQHLGSSSGSYLESVLNFAQLCDPSLVRKMIKIRNSPDHEVTSLTRLDGTTVFRGVKCYGFRNLQNVVRKLKLNKPSDAVDYIEVMACPGGCRNGAGQIKGQSQDLLETKYWERPSFPQEIAAADALADIVELSLGSRSLLTQYKAVKSTLLELAVQW